jgi:hypothetical protein
MKPLCRHASTVNGSDARRTCALGLHGGRVSDRVECQTCESWEPREAGAEPSAPVQKVPGDATKPREKPPPADDCAHFRELSGAERRERGLSHGRRWGLCLHEERPLGETVNPCKGCKPTCPGYRTA